MAALVHAESRRMYSWWWDSHISPKNSKWLKENLSDMDEKIKQMIKLIEEDADSFARRAEMYYKKRPDLLNLVEQFYRAYRALAERYDHATGVLRQAHRSMAEAFPNQVPPDLDDSIFPASSSDHEHALGDDKEFDSDFVGQFLRKELVKLEAENEASVLQYQLCLDKMSAMEKDTEHARVEVQTLKEELLRVQEEKVDMMGQFEKSLKTISGHEKNLADVERCLHDVTERFHGAEIEVDILKQATERMCEEKESASLECRQLLTKVAAVESLQEKVRVQGEELIEKNKEVGRLWSSIQEERLKSVEVENALQDLQNQHFQLQEEIRVLRGCNNDLQDRIKKADEENKKVTELNSSSSSLIDSLRGETISLREIIRKLEKEVEVQVEEQNALHQEIYIFKEKMNMIKDKYLLVMEQVESVGLDPEGVRSYVNKLQDEKSKLREFCDRKLRENMTLLEENALLKNNESVLRSEMEEVEKRLQDEVFMLKESRNQKLEENSTLLERTTRMENVVSDLKSELEKAEQRQQPEKSMLRELCDQKLVENASLLEKNAFLDEMVFGLKSETEELKQKLQDEKLELPELGEKTATENTDLLKLNTRMEDSISCSKSEFEKVKQMLQDEKAKFRESSDENARRSAELLQKNAVLENSVAYLNKLLEEVTLKLEDERAKFKELVDENMRNNVALLENNALLENSVSYLTKLMEESINKNTKENAALIEKNCFLENYVSQLNQVLENVKQKLTASEESQTSLICQLHVAAANSERHEKKSDDSQNSLFGVNAELGRVRIMLKRSEESWLLLLNEKLGLITEKESLSFQLETTKRRLEESLQTCEDLERKCICLSKEREEHSMNTELFKTRVDALESHVMLLQQEALSRNWEFREELDKALNNHFEIFILKNCVRDLEERNFLLSLESQKLVKAYESSERSGVNIKKSMSQKFQELHNSMSELSSENFQHVVQKSVMIAVIEEMQQEMMKISKERDTLYEDLKVQSNRYLLSQNRLREKDAEARINKRKLSSYLLKKKEEAEHWEAQATDFYREMMVSNFREALLEQKVEEVARSKAEEREMLASRIRLLEEENVHLTFKLECQIAREAPLEHFAAQSEISTSLPVDQIRAHTEEIQVHYDHLPEVQIRANTEEIQVHYDNLSEHIRADSEGVLVHYHHFPKEHLRANSTEIQDITLIPRLKSASPVVGDEQDTERGIVPDNSSSSAKSEDGTRQNEAIRSKRHSSHRASDSKPRVASRRREVMKHTNRPGKKSSQHPIHPESEVLTKDILLDQMSKCSASRPTRRNTITGSDERMLELWETTDHSGSIDLKVGGISRKAVHPSRESFSGKELGVDTQEPSEKSSAGSHRGGRYLRRILERLNGDAQKLTNMHITVQDLKRKAEVAERSGSGRTAEYRAVKEQLEETEVVIVSFFDMNHRITKSAKRGYSSGLSNGELSNDDHGSTFRRRISDQARQGSEKIASLQQEIQKIQFFLLKLDDEVEKNSREDVRLVGTSERKTRVLLKDFLHVRVRPTLRRKKGQCCSCVQLPTRAK